MDNELIARLAVEANLLRPPTEEAPYATGPLASIQWFAEAIAEECAKVAEEESDYIIGDGIAAAIRAKFGATGSATPPPARVGGDPAP